MVGGTRAFDAGSQAELVAAVLEHEPPPLSTRAPAVPTALDRLVATCLAKDPDERWQTATDLLRELRWVRHDRTIPIAAAAVAARRTHRPATMVAATLAVAVLAFTGVAASPDNRCRPLLASAFQSIRPAGTKFPRGTAEMALSPDGSRLVFVAHCGRWHEEPLAAAIRCRGEPRDRRKRGRALSVLVTRRRLDCVLRAQQAEANRRGRRRAAGHL